MYYQVAKIQRLRNAGATDFYLLVNCWRFKFQADNGRPPLLTEEFHIRRQLIGRRIVTNANGFLKTALGAFVDPATLVLGQPQPVWGYETFAVDLRAEFKEIIERSLRGQLAAGWSGDRTGDPTKPLYLNGVLVPQRADSRPFEGDGIELPLLRPAAVEVA